MGYDAANIIPILPIHSQTCESTMCMREWFALGLYICNLILGLLLADVAINLHDFSECKVLSSSKDFVNKATTASCARAVAVTGVYLFNAAAACP